MRRSSVCLLLPLPTPLHQLNLQRAGATIITRRISYFTPKESVCRELASAETACLNRETRVISKCLLLLANLDCRPWTVPSWLRCVLSTEQPEDWYSPCQLRREKKQKERGRMNQNLIRLWCIIFISAGATGNRGEKKYRKNNNPAATRRVFKDSDRLKLFDVRDRAKKSSLTVSSIIGRFCYFVIPLYYLLE